MPAVLQASSRSTRDEQREGHAQGRGEFWNNKRSQHTVVYGGVYYWKIASIPTTITGPLSANAAWKWNFRWKVHYNTEVGWEQITRRGFCDLMKKLHQSQGYTYTEYVLMPERLALPSLNSPPDLVAGPKGYATIIWKRRAMCASRGDRPIC